MRSPLTRGLQKVTYAVSETESKMAGGSSAVYWRCPNWTDDWLGYVQSDERGM